ncbi:MAG TPA: MFS transporter [Steroidobacteraceae bacterium]|nr:MFS transporter [Steroidobacteraceae bacterium]
MKRPWLTRPVLGWALYDWANSAFATTVMAGFFPVFFKQYWSIGTEAAVSTFRLGMLSGLGSLVIALAAPLLGAMADRGGARVKLLAFFTLVGAAATCGLYLIGQGNWVGAAAVYSLAGVGFWGGVIFNDALLVDVADPPRYDVVSAFGYSLGYAGGGLLLLLNVAMVTSPARFGLAGPAEAVRLAFPMVAAWWVLFTLPCLFWVREDKPAQALAALGAARAGWRELRATVAEVRKYRPLVWFLLAYWLYIDGVNTIIKMAVDFGLSLGFPQQSLIAALLITQFVGFPAALGFGWLGQRMGARAGIFLAIGIYAATTVAAYWMREVAHFYVLAAVIGLVQGGIQSLSRSYYASLVPEGKQGEFFGFYNMMGKFAAVLGPVLVGVTALATGDTRVGMLSIIVLFVGGAILLARARRAE